MAFCLALLLIALPNEPLNAKLKTQALGLAQGQLLQLVQPLAIPGEEVSWCAALMCRNVLEVKDWFPSRGAFPTSNLHFKCSLFVKLVDRVRACMQAKTSLRHGTYPVNTKKPLSIVDAPAT